MFMVPMMNTLLRQPEPPILLVGVHQVDRLIAVLEQEVELPEHLGEVASVDLVDDQDVRRARVVESLIDDAPHRAGSQLETTLRRGAVALEEVLVGVRRVELDKLHVDASDVPRQGLRNVGLARARGPVEDQLGTITQQLDAVVEPADVYVQSGGQLDTRRRQDQLPSVAGLEGPIEHGHQQRQFLGEVMYVVLNAQNGREGTRQGGDLEATLGLKPSDVTSQSGAVGAHYRGTLPARRSRPGRPGPRSLRRSDRLLHTAEKVVHLVQLLVARAVGRVAEVLVDYRSKLVARHPVADFSETGDP